MGFTVARMHDAEATRDAILTKLTNMINDARPGDVLVFQFAGHGTQVEDFDRDEDDAQDEAFCPVDYAQGRLIIDDDFKGVFRRLATGIGLTCFFDSCHSGSVTRLAVGRTQPPPDSRPRFRPLTPAIIKRHRAFRATLPSSRNAADTSGPADMRQVVFAACKPEQVALESGGRGDFSLRAVQLLPSASTMTNAQFSDAVLRAFGPSPRQHPNLDCAVANRTAPFLGLPTRGTEQPSHAQGAGAVSRDQAVADLLAAAARLIAQTG
jgi:hypothetical protein